jgi:hypothetical protein
MNTLELDDDSLRLLIDSVQTQLSYAESSLELCLATASASGRRGIIGGVDEGRLRSLRQEIDDLTRLLGVLTVKDYFGPE